MREDSTMRFSASSLLVTFVLGVLMAPLAAGAQQPKKGPTIGVLRPWPQPSVPDWKQRSVFLQELRTLGWREGENITFEYRWAAGRPERGAALAAELIGLHVDVIVVDNLSLIRAVQHATTTIPNGQII